MKSLKRKNNTAIAMDVPSFPSLMLTDKQLPELKDKAVGDEFEISFNVTVKGIHQYRNGESEYSLELTEAEVESEEEENAEEGTENEAE